MKDLTIISKPAPFSAAAMASKGASKAGIAIYFRQKTPELRGSTGGYRKGEGGGLAWVTYALASLCKTSAPNPLGRTFGTMMEIKEIAVGHPYRTGQLAQSVCPRLNG